MCLRMQVCTHARVNECKICTCVCTCTLCVSVHAYHAYLQTCTHRCKYVGVTLDIIREEYNYSISINFVVYLLGPPCSGPFRLLTQTDFDSYLAQ